MNSGQTAGNKYDRWAGAGGMGGVRADVSPKVLTYGHYQNRSLYRCVMQWLAVDGPSTG
jgi:hypothetical protein